MSLLPPPLIPSATSASPTSSAASTARRGDDSAREDAESFGDVLSRSLSAPGKTSDSAPGKPAATGAIKRGADDERDDADQPTDAANTAAFLFVPLQSRAPLGAAGAEERGPAFADTDAAPSALPIGLATASVAGQAANDESMADGTGTALQALPASGLPAAGKDRTLPSAAVSPATQAEDAAAAPGAHYAVSPASGNPDHAEMASFTGDQRRATPEQATVTSADKADEAEKASAAPAIAAAGDTAASAALAATTAQPAASASATDAPVNGAAVTFNAPLTPPQGHAASATSAAPAASQAALTPEVGTGEWGKALGAHMAHMGRSGEHVAELQLNPPGLGPLRVTLSMNDNQVQALFVSTHPSVRAAVEAALPQLRSTLAENGISLGNTSVDSGSQQQAAFAQGHPGQPGQSRQYRQGGYLASETPGQLASSAADSASAGAPRRGASPGVDTYA